MLTAAIDFETFYRKGTKNPYSIRGLGNWAYTHHPEFDAYLVSVADSEESWAGTLEDFDWESLRGRRLVSHNKGFDYSVTKRLVELGKAPAWLLDNQWHCTADLSSYLCNRRALDDAAKYLLGVELSKSIRGKADNKTWAQMVAEGWSGDMIKYGRDDSVYCVALWNQFADRWPEQERRLSNINIRQGIDGIGIDIPLLNRQISFLEEALFEVDKTLPWIVEGRKPTSTIGLAEWCRKEGIPCPPTKEEDEEGYDEWEATYAPKFPWVAQISNRRSVNKSLTSLKTVRSRLRPDGTMGFSMKYFGGHTGRYSGGGGFNMQNLKKIPLLFGQNRLPITNEDYVETLCKRYDKEGVWRDESGQEVFDIDARKILTPRNPAKNKFVMCDLSQIEPRVLNWLAGNFELLDRIRGGMAIYEAHARDSMGWTGGDLKSQDKGKYAMAKVRVLGLGYGCGAEKFVTVAWNMGRLRITEEESAAQVKDFRESNPKITGLWRDLDMGLKRAAQDREDFEVELPSGRTMRYEKPRVRQTVEADKDGKPIRRTQVYAGVGGHWESFYGGKICENITQAASRDVFVEHLLDLEDANIDVVWSVHDEAITEVPHDFPACDVARIMSRCPDWLPGCPIGSEAQEAAYYKK